MIRCTRRRSRSPAISGRLSRRASPTGLAIRRLILSADAHRPRTMKDYFRCAMFLFHHATRLRRSFHLSAQGLRLNASATQRYDELSFLMARAADIRRREARLCGELPNPASCHHTPHLFINLTTAYLNLLSLPDSPSSSSSSHSPA